jgi:hypothetical protein
LAANEREFPRIGVGEQTSVRVFVNVRSFWQTQENVHILVRMPWISVAGNTSRGFFDSAPKAGATLRKTAKESVVAVNEDTAKAAKRSS